MSSSEHNPIKTSYVLLKAVRKQVAYIRATIQSVIAQTYKPRYRMFISNGPTDGIIREFQETHSFIELLTFDQEHERNVASKAWVRIE